MYRAITQNIRITVEPRFLPEHSAPDNRRFVWAYTVEITNLGAEPVRLLSRYWLITDANGLSHEVRGEGVIGEQPLIEAGGSFDYTSGCPLETPSGIMRGHYVFRSADGQLFTADIPAFSLDSPFDKRCLN